MDAGASQHVGGGAALALKSGDTGIKSGASTLHGRPEAVG